MDKTELLAYLDEIDAQLDRPTMLYVYGSAALMLLDEPDRTSLDIDVAAPYCDADYGAICRAAERAGIPVNPSEATSSNHIEWVPPLRLCLPEPSPENETVLWKGHHLTLKTGSPPELVASKLIRYDDIDQGDVQYLCAQADIQFADVKAAVERRPRPFRCDAVLLENLDSFRDDLNIWRDR